MEKVILASDLPVVGSAEALVTPATLANLSQSICIPASVDVNPEGVLSKLPVV